MLVHTGCTVIIEKVPGYSGALSGTGALGGAGIIAGESTTNFQSPGPACIATASPPSVVCPAKVPQATNSTWPAPGITKGGAT